MNTLNEWPLELDSLYKNEEYTEAGDSFDRFMKLFPEDAPVQMPYLEWESYRMGNNNQLASADTIAVDGIFPPVKQLSLLEDVWHY